MLKPSLDAGNKQNKNVKTTKVKDFTITLQTFFFGLPWHCEKKSNDGPATLLPQSYSYKRSSSLWRIIRHIEAPALVLENKQTTTQKKHET